MKFAAYLALGFLYRLMLFPWLTAQAVALTIASQINWLLTGQTFEDVVRSRERRQSLDDLLRKPSGVRTFKN